MVLHTRRPRVGVLRCSAFGVPRRTRMWFVPGASGEVLAAAHTPRRKALWCVSARELENHIKLGCLWQWLWTRRSCELVSAGLNLVRSGIAYLCAGKKENRVGPSVDGGFGLGVPRS